MRTKSTLLPTLLSVSSLIMIFGPTAPLQAQYYQHDEQRPRRPQQSGNNHGNSNLGGIISGIGAIIDAASQENGYYPDYEYEYEYQTPQYEPVNPQFNQPPPQPQVPQNPIPSASVPANVVPVQVVAPANYSLRSRIPTLPPADQRRIKKRLDQVIEDDLKELSELNQKITQAAQGAIDAKLKELPKSERDALKAAMSQGNTNAVRDLLNKYRDPASGAIKFGNTVVPDPETFIFQSEMISIESNIQQLRANGGSSRDLMQAIQDMNKTVSDYNAYVQSRPGISQATAQGFGMIKQQYDSRLNQLQASLQLSQWFNSSSSNNGFAGNSNSLSGILSNLLRSGSVPVFFDPQLDAGQCYMMGPGMIAGTGGKGTYRATSAAPAVAMGIPLASTKTVSDARDVPDKQELVIKNLSTNGGTVGFLLAGQTHSLQAGEQQTFNSVNKSVIQFNQGSGKGNARYTLTAGNTYEFVVEGDAWNLRQHTYSLTLDNSASAHDFHYLLDNKVETVKAGSTRHHESDRPVEIVFDRGDGEKQNRILEGGLVRVGIDSKQRVWSLFPEETEFSGGKSDTIVTSTPVEQTELVPPPRG